MGNERHYEDRWVAVCCYLLNVSVFALLDRKHVSYRARAYAADHLDFQITFFPIAFLSYLAAYRAWGGTGALVVSVLVEIVYLAGTGAGAWHAWTGRPWRTPFTASLLRRRVPMERQDAVRP